MRRRKYVGCACVVVFLYWLLGVGDYLSARSFPEDFHYPLDVDLRPVVEDVLAGKLPPVQPINFYPFNFLSTSNKCANNDKIDLLILVKSALEHWERRDAIRQTYGSDGSVAGKVVRTVFFVGTHRHPDDVVTARVLAEREQYADVVQSDFEDAYYNMTIKTMLSIRWAVQSCSRAKHFLFTDDDMYISVRNVLKYVEGSDPSEEWFSGYVFESSPQRVAWSKWRVTVAEWPWDRWPPYATAGAFLLSHRTIRTINAASAFVKHFRFDDIYLGIVAWKAGVPLTHSGQFHFYKKRYTREGYGDVIASHGYGDPQELIEVWTEQNALQRRGQS